MRFVLASQLIIYTDVEWFVSVSDYY